MCGSGYAARIVYKAEKKAEGKKKEKQNRSTQF